MTQEIKKVEEVSTENNASDFNERARQFLIKLAELESEFGIALQPVVIPDIKITDVKEQLEKEKVDKLNQSLKDLKK